MAGATGLTQHSRSARKVKIHLKASSGRIWPTWYIIKNMALTIKEVRDLLGDVGLDAGAVHLVKGSDGQYHVDVRSKYLGSIKKELIRLLSKMVPYTTGVKLADMPRGKRKGFREELAVYKLQLVRSDASPVVSVWSALQPVGVPEGVDDIPSIIRGHRSLDGLLSISKCEYDLVQKADPLTPDEHLVTGVVLEPNIIDGTRQWGAEGDTYDSDTVREAMYWWMENGDRTFYYIHSRDGGKELKEKMDVTLLECWQTRQTVQIGAQTVFKGSWVVTVRVNNAQLWNDIKSGKIKSFSVEGQSMVELANIPREDYEQAVV